jgi:hypothetical protein
MEVHHHPHVEKKGFKEYFLEFVMIFLAVTMGFIVENIREHINESEQGKQYIQSHISPSIYEVLGASIRLCPANKFHAEQMRTCIFVINS